MLTKTIGQLDEITTLDSSDVFEVEASGASKKINIQQLANYCIPCGTLIDLAFAKTPSAAFPAVPLYESDKTISAANYPILVSELRASPASVTLTAGTVITSIDVNITAGSTITSVNSAFSIILAAIVEEFSVQSAYSICVTIGGIDYVVASASTVIGITGAIATGPTSMTVYPHRIVGTTQSAIVFKDTGRATLSHDGKTYIAGFRRRDRMQGHFHQGKVNPSAVASGAVIGVRTTGNTDNPTDNFVANPVTDTVNGTPRTGLTTDPNSNIVYRYLWAQEYLP